MVRSKERARGAKRRMVFSTEIEWDIQEWVMSTERARGGCESIYRICKEGERQLSLHSLIKAKT